MSGKYPRHSGRLSWIGDYTIVDNSFGKDPVTQRDNEIDPHHACVPTSYLASADNANIPTPKNPGMADDDAFTWFCRTDPAVQEYYKKEVKCFYDLGWPANQIPLVAAFAFNRWVGRRAAHFSFSHSIADIAGALLRGAESTGAGFVGYGNFPYLKKDGTEIIISHAVSVAGFAYRGMLEPDKPVVVSNIEAWLVDDPYGDPNVKYRDHDGNDRWIDAAKFNAMMVEEGNGARKTGAIVRL